MITWWLDNQSRLRLERNIISNLESRSPWLQNIAWSLDDNGLQLRVIFDVLLKHRHIQLVMTYHNTFPSSPPSVAPLVKQHLSSHQYGEGELCLAIRPDNWHPDFTGADMIESAYTLLSLEAPDENGTVHTAPSAHNVPDRLLLRHKSDRFYVTREMQSLVYKDIPQNSEVDIALNWSGRDLNYSVAHLVSLKSEEWEWMSSSLPKALSGASIRYQGLFIKTEKKSNNFENISSISELAAILAHDIEVNDDKPVCIIATSDNKLILFKKVTDEIALIKYQSVFSEEGIERRSGKAYNHLKNLKVGIVGLGSLGAKVALILARAGIQAFVLVDDDIMHTENIERHDADWRDVGLHKVDAVSRRLQMIAGDIEVIAKRTSIGAQVSATEAGNVSVILSKCDLIIDATATPNVFNYLSDLATKSGSPMLWGGVYAGGIGGYIAKSRPGIDPDPYTVRNGINEFYKRIDVAPPTAEGRNYNGLDENRFLIASDADISVISAHMGGMAIDLLLKTEPTEFEHHAYVIGMKNSWIFSGAYDVHPILVKSKITGKENMEGDDAVESGFVRELIEKKFDETENRKESD
ncbi:MAG: ThiF family adenylyltransferase [Candidatus Thiodiazotropha endolucinida]